MNTSRTRLQNKTLLAISLCLVMAAHGSAQNKPGDPAKAAAALPAARRHFQAGIDDSFGYFGKSGRLIQSRNIMISWSKNNDELRGFSHKTGEWAHLKVKQQTAIVPTVGSDVAAVRVGDTMAAYSGITGSWDVLKLSKGSKAEAVVGINVVQTTDNDRLYTFAAAKGKWTSPNDPNLRRSSRSNKTSYNPFDQQAVKLARQFRGKGLDDAQARTRISIAVAAAFDQRQSHQKAEAARMQEKLKKIQAAITSREALRERIIARRVDELLDPNIDWDSQPPAAWPGASRR